ncbi:hypothetical protein GS474_10520 [Rhodococcus hoagii]|nr:hypothetical protein [Prescottella equi]
MDPFNPIDTDVFTDTVSSIGEYTFYIQVAAFALSMILLGARLAMARSGAIRDTSEEGFRQMARATSSLARSPARRSRHPALGRHRELVHGRDRR